MIHTSPLLQGSGPRIYCWRLGFRGGDLTIQRVQGSRGGSSGGTLLRRKNAILRSEYVRNSLLFVGRFFSRGCEIVLQTTFPDHLSRPPFQTTFPDHLSRHGFDFAVGVAQEVTLLRAPPFVGRPRPGGLRNSLRLGLTSRKGHMSKLRTVEFSTSARGEPWIGRKNAFLRHF